MQPNPPPVLRTKFDRRNTATLKLLLIAALVLALQIPLYLVNNLRQERSQNLERGLQAAGVVEVERRGVAPEGYRMVERALKHAALVLSLVFTAFFLFEILAPLRLHPVQYVLVGAALCLFYLALLALGEVLAPGLAYVGAAGASSLMITLYSAAVLQSHGRAGVIAALLVVVHGVLYVVLRMENYALLAGTAALFAALSAVMFFTRHVDWHGRDPRVEGVA